MHAQSPQMGRPRTRHSGLPPHLHPKGGSYYYVTHDRRWIPLGNDLRRALTLWADYERAPIDGNTVIVLATRYLEDFAGHNEESTRAFYRRFLKTIDAEWGSLPVDQLQPWHLAQWRDKKGTGKVWANGLISLLRMAYDKAVEWGWCASNPARAVDFNETKERDRELTDDEYRAVRDKAPRWLKLAMELGYATAARPCDILALRWDKVTDVVAVRQRKTKKRQAFALVPEIEEILREAKARPILGLYVIATDKGRPITLRRLQKAWQAACKAAGATGAQFRDIRSKSATDAERAGEDMNQVQSRLGHSTRAMSERYLKGKRTELVQPFRRKL